HDEDICAEIARAYQREQDSPLDQVAVDLHPGRAGGSAVLPVAYHVTQVFQVSNAQVVHQDAEGCARAPILVKLPGAETCNPRAGSHGLQAVLVIARINNTHDLYEKWVKLQFVVAAVGGNERD